MVEDVVFFVDGVFEGLGNFEVFVELVVFFFVGNVDEFDIVGIVVDLFVSSYNFMEGYFFVVILFEVW